MSIPNKKTTYFLETTIQIVRIFGNENHNTIIKKRLDQNNLQTSTYVLSELKRTVIEDLLIFRDKMML